MRSAWWLLLGAGCGVETVEQAPDRWLVRQTGGCAPIAGDGWSWQGHPLRSPAGESPDFCVYDLPSEPELDVPYAMLDEGAGEARELAWAPAEAREERRGGIGNCDVCVSWQDGWLWIVLPPDLWGWTLNGRYSPDSFETSEEQVYWGPVPEDLLGEELYVTL